MRAVCGISLCLVACAGPAALPGGFARAAGEAGGEPCVLLLRGDAVAIARAPLAARELPDPVARTVAAIQPGGAMRAMREWSEAGEGFFVETVYGPEDRRTLRLSADGGVRERSHTIEAAAMAVEARAAIERLRLGTIAHVAAVQGEGHSEWYRATLRDGARLHVVDCGLDGAVRSVERLGYAELRLGR
jgi:hypothetical protein